ncbi:MAG: amino acid permease [Alphaproteobacteria bacterium]|nr:amino acid permease [Alphaproteobacteria bacterium]
MNKQITSVLLVAGTCIGAGMIALPLALAKLGIIPSLVVMLSAWFLTYYPSLVSVELNLQSEHGLSLGLLGRKFSGKKAEMLGEISVKLLSYALLSAYIYGGASIIQKLISNTWTFAVTETVLSGAIIVLLLLPIKIISKVNNMAFIGFIGLFLLLIVKIVTCIDPAITPWKVSPNLSNVASIATIVFTSFGYQVIFHTLRDYCGRDVKMLKRAFFYGSIIPMVIYMIWTCGVLAVIYKADKEFYSLIVDGNVEVGDLVKALSEIFRFSGLQIVIWWVSIFTILTSIIGVGLGLIESYHLSLRKKLKYSKLVSAIVTIVPSYIIATIVPNAFIKTLGMAGSILVVIAIILPTYLFLKAKISSPYIHILKKWCLILCLLVGIMLIEAEIFR